MRLPFALALAASALAAPAAAQEATLSAEDVLTRLVEESDTRKRDAWFNADVKGKAVAWVSPVFNVTTFNIVIVNGRGIERALIACQVPKRFEAAARKVQKGDTFLCAGQVEDYERMLGAALVNVVADNFVVGKENIDAWQKAQKKR